ncbi:hypothetical protein HOH87_05940 [bacterium]|jgi:hypothetical protein|nr:hypothetical protein [bacterium]
MTKLSMGTQFPGGAVGTKPLMTLRSFYTPSVQEGKSDGYYTDDLTDSLRSNSIRQNVSVRRDEDDEIVFRHGRIVKGDPDAFGPTPQDMVTQKSIARSLLSKSAGYLSALVGAGRSKVTPQLDESWFKVIASSQAVTLFKDYYRDNIWQDVTFRTLLPKETNLSEDDKNAVDKVFTALVSRMTSDDRVLVWEGLVSDSNSKYANKHGDRALISALPIGGIGAVLDAFLKEDSPNTDLIDAVLGDYVFKVDQDRLYKTPHLRNEVMGIVKGYLKLPQPFHSSVTQLLKGFNNVDRADVLDAYIKDKGAAIDLDMVNIIVSETPKGRLSKRVVVGATPSHLAFLKTNVQVPVDRTALDSDGSNITRLYDDLVACRLTQDQDKTRFRVIEYLSNVTDVVDEKDEWSVQSMDVKVSDRDTADPDIVKAINKKCN